MFVYLLFKIRCKKTIQEKSTCIGAQNIKQVLIALSTILLSTSSATRNQRIPSHTSFIIYSRGIRTIIYHFFHHPFVKLIHSYYNIDLLVVSSFQMTFLDKKCKLIAKQIKEEALCFFFLNSISNTKNYILI